MELTVKMAMEVAHHEAVIRQAYKDSVGVWTWSVGLTNGSGHNVKRYIGKPQTLEHCLSVYVWALKKYLLTVEAEFEGFNMTEAQVAGALSFHWNTGKLHKASWPDMWKAGKIPEAMDSFMEWDNPPEIIPRRKAERDLFFKGKWSQGRTMGEYTRVRANGTPDWGSREEVEVRDILEKLIGGKVEQPVLPELALPVMGQVDTSLTAEEAVRQVKAIMARVR